MPLIRLNDITAFYADYIDLYKCAYICISKDDFECLRKINGLNLYSD